MITNLNNYVTGYSVIPVIDTCKKHGLFETLNKSTPISFSELVKRLQANSGHFRVALNLLEALNWVSRNNKDKYLLTSEADICNKIPKDIMNIMSFPMDDYLNGQQHEHSLRNWIELSSRHWDIGESLIGGFLDGMLAVPLLLALKDQQLINLENSKGFLVSNINVTAREEIIEFFINQGWLLQKEGITLFTDKGLFIMEKISMAAHVASYRPMLIKLSELLFGKCKAVFEDEQSVQEFDIACSGLPPEEYFSDMEKIILSVFDRKPYEEQPKYIAEIGCGDGTRLKKIFEIIKNKSSRGKVLNQYPVKLIGIDSCEKSLEKATDTLQDVEHIILKENYGNFEQVIADLKNAGIEDVENIIYLRSFLDHNRMYVPPADTFLKNVRSSHSFTATYVDREGNEIPEIFVIRNLVEHLKGWSSIIGRHGLIILEEHSLEAKIVSNFIDKYDGMHFDAYRKFSQQLLVEANKFLMAAAEVGLFPKQGCFCKYPKMLPFSQVTLSHFEQREYKVRCAQEADLPELEQLEKGCWEPDLQRPDSVLKKRLKQYPEGQLVLEIDNKIAGVIYSQRIADTEELNRVSMYNVETLHKADGSAIQLLAINVLPELQHKNLGDQLLEFMLERCSLLNGIERIVAVTKCRDYHKHSQTTPQDYIRLRNEQGRLVDTILRFHELHGGQIKELVSNYRPADKTNKGYGVLVEYATYNRQRNDIQVSAGKLEIDVQTGTIGEIKDFIVKAILVILGKTDEEGLFLDQPLMEMGLNSADLLELNEKIRYTYQIPLEPTFFFKYNTVERMIPYLKEHVDLEHGGNNVKEKETISSAQSIQDERSKKDMSPVLGCTSEVQDGIAIIGVACRLPNGIKNKEQLWELLKDGKAAISKMPQPRWSWPENIDTKIRHEGIDFGGFLDEIANFDAAFFRISPKEAELMDPQQRMLLELSWECLEDGGYPAKKISSSKTGVFVGASGSDYNRLFDRHLENIEAHYGVGSSMAVLPNRISYFYDFHGPSIQIDTACSSSLVAVHEAVKSLQAGECKQALVGGINIICHPSNSIAYYKAGMLAKDGRCKTFDKEANGYVRGEGAVMMLLKPLEQAIDDQDSIYAVIKGTAINHGGQASGLTVPNPERQAELLVEAYKTAGIEPETVGYIEAHGTGTALGDPIEISGLKEAFSYLSQTEEGPRKPYCGLGSIKTNIGHLEAAAGIAGLLKVVLSMRHKILPASLNFNELNSHIILDKTPFYIVNENRPWLLPDGQSLRRAGVSSFGSGGANAHIVLEEAVTANRVSSRIVPWHLICLSAKTEKGLEKKEKDLAAWLEKEGEESSLSDISATLLLGRDHFKIRAAYVVRDIEELKKKLKAILERGQAEGCYRESRKTKEKQLQPLFMEMGQTILKELSVDKINEEAYINKLMALAELYVKGYDLDWKAIYADSKAIHIALPTYPFAREHYWIPDAMRSIRNNIETTSTATSVIHPLLHQNTSDFSEQRFSSNFTGQEFFLKDHIIKGQKVLPGVAYLEMARAAVEKVTGNLEESKIGIQLKNVVWARPIVVDKQPVQVHIGLFLEEDGGIAYEIYSESESDSALSVVHSQGIAKVCSVEEVPTLDIKTIQDECNQSSLSFSQCYEKFKGIGFCYGPGQQGLEKVYVGQNQVLAKLSLPSSVSESQDQFILHPSLMDSALQASLLMGSGDFKLKIPFALEELETFGKCNLNMWALVRYSKGSKVGDKVEKLDIDLCDEQGNVCIQMKGISMRVLAKAAGSAGNVTRGTIILESCWKEKAVAQEVTVSDYADHLVMLCESGEVSQANVENKINGVRYLILQSEQQGIGERFQDYAVQAFGEIQNILKAKPKGKVLIQLVVWTQGEQQLVSGLSGLLKTAQLENPKLMGQLIEVDERETAEEIIEKLKDDSKNPIDNHIRYQNDKRYVASWREIEVSQETVRIPWKDQGVYLITGGAGGLGLLFAEEIAQKVKEVTLVLTGRSPLTEEKETKLKELEILGARIVYQQVDVTDRKAVESLIQSIQDKFGSLAGIIHSAGVIRDNFIIKKTKEEFEEVLAPKVTGLVNLDQASKDMSLDFFVFFSSIAGGLGNPGQGDYSTANAFMDAYAKYRNSLVVLNQRQGQTLSINWPLWKEGGMHVDEETEKMLKQSLGMIALQTVTGIRGFYQGLAFGKDQVMVMEGDLAKIKQKLLFVNNTATLQTKKASIVSQSITRMDNSNLSDKVQAKLMQIVSKLLKVKLSDIDANTELNEYGFDSITFTEFANRLNEEYKLNLTPTIFFEQPTLYSFAEYLIEEHQNVFAEKFVAQSIAKSPIETMEDEVEEKCLTNIRRRPHFAKTVASSVIKPDASVLEPIAIIGMSGIFPMAKDVNEFWRNLVEGKDCIVEIPKERWDWQEYYGDPTQEANRTNIKWGGFIEGVGEFDSLFFGISPREAQLMDPQQRLLMTYVWKAIEDAGYSAQSLSGTQTAIFVGTTASGYSGLISKANIAIEGYSSTGAVPSVGPNRMSYFLNIHGPSEPIETACSSSLVALHRAVSVLENGTCDMVIAGGINTIVTPELHISFNKAGMLSEDGRCKTFSDQANGYVRGEGAGMVLLKRLKDAERDGDHIYGVIRGTSENHGGRANSLTAPNPKAQAELIKSAYTKAGIDPRTVTYIEAHGTGTELGDPIEINGLKTAFKDMYEATGDMLVSKSHCGVGSVKTNIGHLEFAAGIAGVVKVLLQIKHKTLVKSLHCDVVNPYIQLKDSPFYIVQESEEWVALRNSQGKELPRRAGVSSFGFGGANAHVIIEEYIPEDQERKDIKITRQNPAMIVLSAKNEERLKEQAQRLLEAIREQEFSDGSLADMAYTLQVGREAMEERLAVLVASIEELEEKLEGFVKGQEDIEELYRGQVKQNKETVAVFTADEDLQKALDAWIAKGKYEKLLDLWVKGLIFNWEKLYEEIKPRRISLPTYSFAKERYWVPKNKSQSGESSVAAISASASFLHPLVQQNTSNVSGLQFSSKFTGQEFFLRDHVVKGQKVLPGVAYLEMARAAMEQASGTLEEGVGIHLKNIVWNQPVIVGEQAVQVHIGLYPEDNGEIAYEIYSDDIDVEGIVYSQGRAILSEIREASILDIKELQEQCNQKSFSPSQCYEAFSSVGINYGPGHQGIEKVYVGSGQVLAKLSLPASVIETQDQFVLHPGMMDSALQATIGLMNLDDLKLTLPVALQELEVVGKCTSVMWALIRYSEHSKKMDIDLCDDQGKTCMKMRGLDCQEAPETINYQKSLQPLIATGTNFSNVFQKPCGIALRVLSDEKKLSKEKVSRQEITLSMKNGLLSQIKSSDESKMMVNNQKAISLEELEEELITSLAEVLYMKRSDVDVDRKFIDMGLDSIVGVEWVKVVNKRYSTSITATKVYDYPSIREFAGFLRGEVDKQDKKQLASTLMTPVEKRPSSQIMPQSIQLSSIGSTIVPMGTMPKPIKLQVDNSMQSNISVETLQKELAISLAEVLCMKQSEVDLDKKFINIGMDSIIGVEWIKVVNKQYGTSIMATKVYDYPSIREFADFLKKELSKGKGESLLLPSFSYEEILEQVFQGSLDVEQANQLLFLSNEKVNNK
jgi:polyketide synthase PksN